MGGGGGGYAARLFLLFSFPCSADHERDWPPCKVVFFGLTTNTLNVRNNCCCCCLNKNLNAPRPSVVIVVVVSHIQRIGCQPEKTTLHGAQSRSWSAEQGKENKRKSLAAYPPPTPHTARSEKINKITRRIYRRYAGGRSRVRTRKPSARRLTRPMGVASQNSTLPLLLSSPGDV